MHTINITKSTPLKDILKIGEQCDKCGRCCSFGSGFIMESEIPQIAAFLKMKKEDLIKDQLEETEIFHTKMFKFKIKRKKDKPYGPCIFLDDNKCKIQNIKPLHCRIGNCKEHGDDLHTWFIINYCLNIYDPESIRQYNSYLETGGRRIPGAELDKLFPDKKMLSQILSYERLK